MVRPVTAHFSLAQFPHACGWFLTKPARPGLTQDPRRYPDGTAMLMRPAAISSDIYKT